RPAASNDFYVDNAIRLTVQATPKHKFTHEDHLQHGCQCLDAVSSTMPPESVQDFQYGPQILSQTTWSYTATSKLLIQAGATFLFQGVNFSNGGGTDVNYLTGVSHEFLPDAQHISIKDNLTQVTWNAIPGGVQTYGMNDNSNNFNQRIAA